MTLFILCVTGIIVTSILDECILDDGPLDILWDIKEICLIVMGVEILAAVVAFIIIVIVLIWRL